MADREAYARFCGISPGQISARPEHLDDPKQDILGWADGGKAVKLKRHVDSGRRRGLPDWAILGEWHADFAENVWSPQRAAKSGRAPSLRRTLERVKALIEAL
jgi:hypothetical protein